MKSRRRMTGLMVLLATLASAPVGNAASSRPMNGGFENGGFEGWIADPNWVVASNACGYYSGWDGRYWAWSGGRGEAATGVLRSRPFVLDKPAVGLWIAGWSSIHGTGQPRRWNHVSLHLEDGAEIDRVYTPDTTQFMPALLDGTGHRGETVYLQAVDDADQPGFSMVCIDRVRTVDLPAGSGKPLRPLPKFNPKRSVRLENDHCLVEVDRVHGSITRFQDKPSGLELIREPRLAGSYRFALPIPGKEPWQTLEANWILGKDQELSACHLRGSRLTLHWNGPLKNHLGEPFDASARVTLQLRNHGLWCALEIDNRTPFCVGETYFPVLGGIQGLGHRRRPLKATELVRPTGPATRSPTRQDPGAPLAASAAQAFTTAPIFRVFNNMSWLGDQGPEQCFVYPEQLPPPTVADAPKIPTLPEPWIGFQAPGIGRSMLLGALDPRHRTLYFRLELVPASSGTLRDDGNWPRPEELQGLPVGVELSLVDMQGGPAARSYQAAPVFLRFVDGGGVEMRSDFATWRGE